MRLIMTLVSCTWAVIILGCGYVQTESTGKNPVPDAHIPMGRLGYPLGSYLTIEGSESPDRFKGVDHLLVVDKVNGKNLAKPIGVELRHVESPELPAHERCIVRGYETGWMEGIPEEVVKAENIPTFQTRVWGFARVFMVTSVIEPESLKVRP